MSVGPFITARDSPYLSVHNTGLGNVLFQIASSYGISNNTGRPLSYHYVAEYCRILKSRFNFNHGETILKHCLESGTSVAQHIIVHEPGGSHHAYVPTIIETVRNGPPNAMMCLYGYMESIKYFADYREQIRALFTADEVTISNILRVYPILGTCHDTVSIHFRWYEYTYIYDQAYYRAAIAYIKNMCPSAHFMVFSDNTSKVPFEALGLNEGEYTIVKNPYDYLDLWTMSCCKHHIVSKSTFSYWGQELRCRDRTGVVVCPANPEKFDVDWYPDTVVRV